MRHTARPVVLIVLDGWGLSDNRHNILHTTSLPTFEKLRQLYPLVGLQASGISVGIPWGEAGNSEVGHIALGSGRIVYQSLPRISLAIQDESFYFNPALAGAADTVIKNNSTLHVMGLLSSGAVHSHYDHILAMLEIAKRKGLTHVMIHPFTDGRDSAPTDGITMITRLQKDIERIGVGRIASISGRHWAMDRNNNWDRTQRAYNMLRGATETTRTTNLHDYLQDSYKNGTTDEFIEPAVVTDDGSEPIGPIRDGDAVVFVNFREDRARQISQTLALDDFTEFDRGTQPDVYFATMTEYAKNTATRVAFPPHKISNTLGEVLSDYGKRQLRIAETEKYAHVTYFFNGGAEKPFDGEDRTMIPSPNVMRFDEAPEMSAAGITEHVVNAVNDETYDFILINYANADMVGHTGNEKASREAVRFLDTQLATLIPAVLKKDGAVLITADHGNVEELYNESNGMISTEHSANPVPLFYITAHNHRSTPRSKDYTPKVSGLLSDVAPTILSIMGLETPREMHGQNLLPIFKAQK